MRSMRLGLVLAAVGSVLLAACGGGSTGGATNAADVSATIRAANWGGNPTENALVKKYEADFMTLYPKIKVTQEEIPTNFEDKIKTEMSANNEPDAMYVSTALMNFAAPAGRLLDLTSLMSKWGVSSDEYISTLMTPWQLNGKQYALPKDFGDLVLFYNKSMFSAAGLATPASWDDIKADAKTLTKGGVKGLSLPADAARFDAFLLGFGGQVLSSDKTKAVLNSQQAQDALSYYSSFQLQDKSSALPDTLGATWPGDAFGKQKAAMVIEGGWLIPYMHDTYPSVSYGSIQLPKFPVKQSSLLFTNGWGCSAKTKNQDACMLFVKYMTGKVVQQQVLQSGFALPSRKDLGSDPAITANPDVKNLFDSAVFATAWTFGPHESKINDAQNAALQSVLLGKSDVKTALDKAETDANAALSGG
ncbi:MAG: multiple sugar transport system substrate-binding protein [Chloroflexota bacterium]|nr:multiple sugar transport system substrate-binding protein [Chloroflexota bacterium]